MRPTTWPNVLRDGRNVYTRNADIGHRVYGEDLKLVDGVEYRTWDPWRSKLAALLVREASFPSLPDPVESVLYLGAAHGTTVSHVADLFPKATVYAVEKSPVAFGQLLVLAHRRSNVLPILADAQLPERYAADVGRVDLLYQDIAQRAQTTILLENATTFLNPRGCLVFMLKVRSVTQTRTPRAITQTAQRELTEAGYRVLRTADLSPFARDHVAFWMTTFP
ncbi:MAG: fibrillarin-like rRNA/tRNA 2'-O-methyltransferase [Thermoplasmata archaeon]